MKKRNPLIWIITIFIIIVIAASLFLSNLGNPSTTPATPTYVIPTKIQPSDTPIPTFTPDPCSLEKLPDEISVFHKLMRKFEDTYLLAQNTPIQSVAPLISEMQQTRREAEDYEVPACIADLKQYMLAYMNTVIETLMTFTSGGDVETINQGVAQAQSQHDAYFIELSRLIGWTLVPTPSTPQPDRTLTPSG